MRSLITTVTAVAIFFLLTLAFAGSPSLEPKGEDESTPAQLALGEKVFETHCKSCHLEKGKSRIKRLNLSDSNWMHGSTLEEIRKTVSDGVEASQMAPFKEKLNAEELEAVARYVMSLSKPAPPAS